MRLFRSVEEVRREYPQPGELFSAAKLWRLARAWYGDRLSPDWEPRSRDEHQEILERLGFAGPFWQLP